ncbi:SAPK-interacting protein 1 [Lycorma delicatula]|uniref:SAPK-interacting protein 1 n=1 Tax=Lycorma delicatula TaxID=130591 RepID=UPI003F5162A9
MAFYDNKHWLLSHIRTSFISSDDTGMSEDVMTKDNLLRQLEFGKYECYPGVEESDEDDLDILARSFDINLGVGYGPRSRPRSNTAARLQKLDEEKKKASNVRHVKWEKSPITLSDEEKKELFKRKNFRQKKKKADDGVRNQSLLVKQLENYPYMPQNPFQEYAKYDGNAQVGVATKRYGIYLTMLDQKQRGYPMHVVIIATARVLDLIGLVCWRCTIEHADTVLKESVDYYSLYIAEDDGEVDSAFPCLDARETVAKFGFGFLALVERDPQEIKSDRFSSREIFPLEPDNKGSGSKTEVDSPSDVGLEQQMQRLQGDMNAIDATLYQSYQVYMINRVKAKTEMHLGISGEKLELDPAVHYRSPRFWVRHKAATYDMDYVVACDLTETKSHSKSTFRLVYDNSNGEGTGTFKSYDFEADHKTATEIVQKVNHILELRPSTRRKDYIAMRNRKSHRRKSFHIGPR